MQEEQVRSGKVHPKKFAMWIAITSIVMMFAGLTSAYLVRQANGDWRDYTMPSVFWISTIVIVASSLTLLFGKKQLKVGNVATYRAMMWVTLVLGIAFCVLQAYGFYLLYATPQDLIVNGVNLGEQRSVTVGGNVSESFLFIIVGAHMIHIIGGIIALLILLLLGYWKRYNVQRLTLSTEILGAYWHFVDILWIYLFIFFLVNQ